jgi:hypothetical protein
MGRNGGDYIKWNKPGMEEEYHVTLLMWNLKSW